MEKDELLAKLDAYQARLTFDVKPELNKDYDMGVARWDSWCISIKQFFEQNLPGYLQKVISLVISPVGQFNGDTYVERFENSKILPIHAFLKSLILDVQDDDYLKPLVKENENSSAHRKTFDRKAFIVHGHDTTKKIETARFLEKLGFQAVILDEQANGGDTIIEKLEKHTDVGFGIVLYTPDDEGKVKAQQIELRPRARQNVIFEHGLLIGKLSRDRVFPLVTDTNIELPSDISGAVYMTNNGWEFQLAKEIKNLGYEIDVNKLL